MTASTLRLIPPVSLATRPVYMDDNARPHPPRPVTAYLQSEAVTFVPWPAMSPDFNPIEHIWDMLGRRIQAREPPVQNTHQLEAQLAVMRDTPQTITETPP
jgi:transposase